MFQKVYTKQEIISASSLSAVLQEVASNIEKNRFLMALTLLSQFVKLEGRSREDKGVIINDLDCVLELANKIFVSGYSSLIEKKKSCELCLQIHLARVIVYTRKLENEPYSVSPDLWNATVDAANFFSKQIILLSNMELARGIAQAIANETQVSALDKLKKIFIKEKERKKRQIKLAQNSFEAGEVAVLKKEYAVALEHYERAIARNPNHDKAHFGAARCCRRLGEEKMQQSRFSIAPAAADKPFLNEVVIVRSVGEGEFYEKSEKYFFAGLKLLADKSDISEIYREIAYLFELKGNYGRGVSYFILASKGDTEKFYEFYRNLCAQEFLTKPFHLIYRFDFLIHDPGFEKYYIKHCGDINYQSGLHLDYGRIYECYDLFDSAVQQYLLALRHSKTESQTKKVLACLNTMLFDFQKQEKRISLLIFKNIMDLTTLSDLEEIKVAYVEWMRLDLLRNDFDSAVKKFLLIATDDSFYELMDASILSHMGIAFTKIQAKDLDSALACYQAAFRKAPECPEVARKLKQLQVLKNLRSEQVIQSEARDVYSLGASSPVLYKDVPNGTIDKLVTNPGCN